jgi:hypothetical protein
MSWPGVYILGLRQGARQDRIVVGAATGIDPDRQRLIEETEAAPTYQERRAYASHFGFAGVEEFDEGWRPRVVRLSRGERKGMIPVINLAPAGEARDYHEVYPDSGIGYAYIDPPPGVAGPNLFAFVVVGDSMEPDYPQGCFAVCRPTPATEIPDGAAVFVRFGASRDHTCTFKRCYRVDALTVELRPINSRHGNLTVAKEEIDRMSPVVATVARRAESSGTEEAFQCIADDVQDENEEGGA